MKNNILEEYGVQTQTDRLAELIELLGDDVVLIPNDPRSKTPSVSWWTRFTPDHVRKPNHLAKLRDPANNIGVLLGKASGNLCVLDLDNEEVVESFLADNPGLENTLRTVGGRGCAFWLRMNGDYPARKKNWKNGEAGNLCEFRTNGCQQVITGIHPTGTPYRMVVRQPPVEFAYSDINFTSLNNHQRLRSKSIKTKGREIENFALTASTSLPLNHSSSHPLCQCDEAVKMALPECEHANHSALFTLARAVKTMQAQGTITTQAQVIAVFNEWHRQAKNRGVLRANQSRDQYLMEFLDALRHVKFLLTDDVIDRAWKAAQIAPFPPEAGVFETDEAKRFVGLCYQMHVMADGGEWFIPTRTAAKLLEVSHQTVCTWFGGLIELGILRLTQKHTIEKSPRYKYQLRTITKEYG